MRETSNMLSFKTPMKLPQIGVFFYLFLLSILIRFPFFFRDYVDRDESTFILMAQAWVDGYLPYTHLWDVKPPLTFLFYAIIIFLFGKSFIAIRLAGALMVALSSYFSFKIANTLGGSKTAIFCGISSVYLQSMFGSIQGVMSEHILMAAFMAALYYIIQYDKVLNLFFGGILIGISLMIKISIAFPVLCIGLYMLVYFYREQGFKQMAQKISVLVFPALAIILATILPYFLMDKPEIWWNSVILAPLAYTEARRSSILSIIGICIPVFALLVWAQRSKRIDFGNPQILILILCLIGILLSFLKGGRVNSHYLIQLYPPLLILIAVVWKDEINGVSKKAIRWLIPLMLVLPIESYLEYSNIVSNKVKEGTYFNGEGFRVPEYLVKNQINTTNILFLEYHIGYWMLEAYPPSKTATHPSNICKSEMFPYYNEERSTGLEEIQYIIENLEPETIVTRNNKRVFNKSKVAENEYIQLMLKKKYKSIAIVENANIYSRLK